MGVHVAPIGIISLCAFVNPFRKSNLIIQLSPLFHSIYALHGSQSINWADLCLLNFCCGGLAGREKAARVTRSRRKMRRTIRYSVAALPPSPCKSPDHRQGFSLWNLYCNHDLVEFWELLWDFEKVLILYWRPPFPYYAYCKKWLTLRHACRII